MGLEGLAAAEIIALTSAVIAAGSGAYAGYVANDNAIDQKHALNEQKKQEAERAAAQAEQMREDAMRLQGTQLAAMGASGLDVSGGGTVDLLLQDTSRLASRDQNMLQRDLNNRLSNLTAQQNMLPGSGQAIASGMLNFGSSALNIYGNYNAAVDRQNLLALQKQQLTPPGNFFTAQPTAPSGGILSEKY